MKALNTVLLAGMLIINAGAEMRTWTNRSGQVVIGNYVRTLFDDVVVEQKNGKQKRIPLDDLAEKDREYLELVNPPQLSIDFLKSERQEFVRMSPHIGANKYPPTVLMYRFGARVKQTDTTQYSLPLKVVIYAFAQQRYDSDKYHYIARIESKPFFLNEAKDGKYEFMDSKEVRLIKYQLEVTELGWEEPRGEKFSESLILVTDQRGEVIAYNSSKNWLYDNLDKLEKLPFGAWFDNSCIRVHPTPPRNTKTGEPIH